MSTLAQQLQKLKIAQKDEIDVPERTRLSFLFDIKQAANVDDQTLYYICVGGIREISAKIPELYQQLQAFQSDLLSEKSLEFYRGTQTKDVVKHVDDQLALLIKILSPYFLHQSTHKIIEYLVRIYEIHAYHKETIAFAFLPYFETSFYLRMLQLLNIKQDEMWYYLEPYSYSGQLIDQKTLLKGLVRNNATLFAKYSEFCFSLVTIQQGINQDIDNCLHWKFFGAMLSEILRQKEDDSTLLFNLLPFISQGMKSQIKDLRMASLIGISQLACRKSLTKDYSVAFFRQILMFMQKNAHSDEEIGHSLIVLVLLSQFQKVDSLSAKDVGILIGIDNLSTILNVASQSHDISSLITLIIRSALNEPSITISSISHIFGTHLNLKSVYQIIETVITTQLGQPENKVNAERTHEILVLIKKSYESYFNQAILFLLKQVQNNETQRDQIVQILSGNNKSSKLISKFGDKEYSILSSLASQSKVTKMSAITALLGNEFSAKLTQNERDLVKISLAQLILRNTEEEQIVHKGLEAYVSLINMQAVSDSEFDVLEQFIASNIGHSRYSEASISLAAQVASKIRVSAQFGKTDTQLCLAFSFDHIHSFPADYGKFKSPSSTQFRAADFTRLISKDIVAAQNFIMKLLTCNQRWVNSKHTIELISKVIEENHKNLQAVNSLYLTILNALKQCKQEGIASMILGILIINLKKSEETQVPILRKLIGLSLAEKQSNKEFDVSSLIKKIFQEIFGASHQRFAEFLVSMALESKSVVKQVFAIISLEQMTKTLRLTPQIQLFLVLTLTQSPSKVVRDHGLRLAATFSALGEQGKELEIFTETPKPKSTKKVTDREAFTPLKIKPLQKIFNSLNSMKDEISQDVKQVAIALNQSAHVGQIDHIVRLLLDLPSYKMKTEFINSLKVLNKFSIVFAMSLQEQLNKEYFTFKQGAALSEEQNTYLISIGNLISKIAQTGANDTREELISSLVYPYLQFALNSASAHELSQSFEEQIQLVLEGAVLKGDILGKLRTEHKTQALRLYVQSQLHIRSKQFRQQLRAKLISQASREDEAPAIINDKDVSPLFVDIKDKIIKQKDVSPQTISYLEAILETLIQLKVQNEQQLLPSILHIITILSKRTQSENVFYIIELCVLASIQILQSASKLKTEAAQTLQLVTGILSAQFQTMKDYVNEVISTKSTDINDPFQQFIMEVDTGKPVSAEAADEENEKLLTVFQIVSSVLNLLLQFETSLLTTSAESQKFLQSIADLLKTTILDDKSQTVRGHNMIQSIFRFYQTQVLKTTGISIKINCDIKGMIATFIDSLLLMERFHYTLDQQHFALKQLVGDSTYTSFAIFVLLTSGMEAVSIKEDTQLDSVHIKLSSRLLSESKDIFGLVEELTFFITIMHFSEASNTFAKQRLQIMFPTETVDTRLTVAQWVYEKYVQNEKAARKFKYIAVYLLNMWISQNELIQKQMAFQAKQNKDTSNEKFYYIYLSSSVFNETVNQALQSKEFAEDKKNKKSLQRLHSRIQDFQKNFNNLLSYEVQVSIVNKVLNEFKDIKQTINLRTITLQLLLNKTPQFATSLSKIQEKELTVTFAPLVKNAIQILTAALPTVTQKLNNDKQNFIMALFSLFQRVISTQLSADAKEKILKLVLSFNDVAASFNLMVHSQLMLTSMTLFEVYHLDILEHLHRYFEQLSSSFARVSQQADFFSESFTKTLLKSCLSICTFFSKFLTATQYESIIKHVLVISSKQFSEETKAILDVISKEATKHVGFKLIFQAMINSYDDVIVSRVSGDAVIPDVSGIIIRFFNDLVKQVVMRVKKEFIIENHKRIFQFFSHAFTLALTYSKHSPTSTDMPEVKQVETCIAQSYEQFVIKMSEDQLRPLIVKQVKQAFIAQEGEAFSFNKHRVIMFFRTINTLLGSMREFFVPMLPLYFEKLLACLTLFGQSAQTESLKRKRLGTLEFDQDDEQNHTLFELLQLVVENTRINFSYDNLSFIQNDTVEKVSEPLASLVTLSGLSGKYTTFIESHLKPAVFEVVERINNDDMWKKINYDILMHTRNANSQVRLGAFRIIEHLFSRIGERYLILLNDTIPFLSEGMEDENPDVEQCAKSIVARIEQMTGDSIHEYLK
ncbi:hypothetical protein FGO68_gene2900 [Halteria grandinella]|uniref:HEAT repeat-containing protein 1 n=1 Tax=Halteria grandinella TaxID=5974 RepID=A0A8J8P5J5_HALGN|nr:hypothetical protein FGO68_gene2900 [Halteria grandinella]